jgi:hypothetical protein
MVNFRKGDIVQVKFATADAIENWMRYGGPGPDDIGVVYWDNPASSKPLYISVLFPMVGTVAIYSSHLILLEKASESENKA